MTGWIHDWHSRTNRNNFSNIFHTRKHSPTVESRLKLNVYLSHLFQFPSLNVHERRSCLVMIVSLFWGIRTYHLIHWKESKLKRVLSFFNIWPFAKSLYFSWEEWYCFANCQLLDDQNGQLDCQPHLFDFWWLAIMQTFNW